jgi:hypothetical protein
LRLKSSSLIKNSMNKKTLAEVYKIKTNRTLKVIYILFYLLFIGIALTVGFDSGFDSEWWIGVGITWAIFEFIKRGFYYITAGDIAPDENENEIFQQDEEAEMIFESEQPEETEITFVPNMKKNNTHPKEYIQELGKSTVEALNQKE